MWKTLSEHLYVNNRLKCEKVWWTVVEDETLTSETGKQGNREHVLYVQCAVCIVE